MDQHHNQMGQQDLQYSRTQKDRQIEELRSTLQRLQKEQEDRDKMQEMLEIWEQRLSELSSEKNKLSEQYESVEHEEVGDIRRLRKEAAEMRVCLADDGSKNDELYQTITGMNREAESINRDYYHIKNKLHDCQQELNNVEEHIDDFRRQKNEYMQEQENIREEERKLVEVDSNLKDELQNQHIFQRDLDKKMEQAMFELQNLEAKIEKLTNDGIEPNVKSINQLDGKIEQIQNQIKQMTHEKQEVNGEMEELDNQCREIEKKIDMSCQEQKDLEMRIRDITSKEKETQHILEQINRDNDQLDQSCHEMHEHYEQLSQVKEEQLRKQLTLIEENDIMATELEVHLNTNEKLLELMHTKAQQLQKNQERKRDVSRIVEQKLRSNAAKTQVDLTNQNQKVHNEDKFNRHRKPSQDPLLEQLEYRPLKFNDQRRQENGDDAGKIVHRMQKTQSQIINMPYRSAKKSIQETSINRSIGGGYVPKFQMMSNLNGPHSRHLQQQIDLNIRSNIPSSRHSINRGLTNEPPHLRSIESSHVKTHHGLLSRRPLSSEQQSKQIRSPPEVNDPQLQMRMYQRQTMTAFDPTMMQNRQEPSPYYIPYKGKEPSGNTQPRTGRFQEGNVRNDSSQYITRSRSNYNDEMQSIAQNQTKTLQDRSIFNKSGDINRQMIARKPSNKILATNDPHTESPPNGQLQITKPTKQTNEVDQKLLENKQSQRSLRKQKPRVASQGSPIIDSKQGKMREHSSTVDQKVQFGAGQDDKNNSDKKEQQLRSTQKINVKIEENIIEVEPVENQKQFYQSFKELPNTNMRPDSNLSDYRAGEPSLSGQLSIAGGRSAGKSAGKSGRSGRKARGTILDAYAAVSDKSQEKTPVKGK